MPYDRCRTSDVVRQGLRGREDRPWTALQISRGQPWDGLNLLGDILARVRIVLPHAEPDEMLRRTRQGYAGICDRLAASPGAKGKGKKGKGKGKNGKGK